MTQISNPLPINHDRRITCYYCNATSNIQLVRLTNISNCCFERVVFPKERLLFEALPDAQLEIHTRLMDSEITSDKISCKFLRVKEEVNCSLETTHEVREQTFAAL